MEGEKIKIEKEEEIDSEVTSGTKSETEEESGIEKFEEGDIKESNQNLKEKKEEEREEDNKARYEKLKNGYDEINDKYIRLYAEFENYRKRMIKNKEDLLAYSKEEIVADVLPIIDSLELALSHVEDNTNDSLAKGVEMTLKELKRVLGNFGLLEIEAKGKLFDPNYHHAMSEVERDGIDDKTVIEEMRKGYLFKDKVMRPSLVSVSKKVKREETEMKGDSQAEEGES